MTQMKLLRLSPIALAASVFAAQAQDRTTTEPVATVVVSASADASAQGLPSAYAGGQVARGGRLGLLGNVDIMDTPFSATNYTLGLIQDVQARSVGDVVQSDPAVRSARGFGNYQELYMIRGFPVYSDDMAYNGLYGLLPRQFVASELLERVEVLRGANSFVNGASPGGAIGGSVNLLPKRATNAPLTQVTAGVETGGQAYVATDVSRRFGDEGRLGVRVNAVRRDGDTAVSRESRELSVYAIGMDYRGRGYRLSADVGHQDHQLRGARPSVTVNDALAIPAAPSSDSNYAQPWTFSGERDTFGTLRAEADLPGGATAWAAMGMRKGFESNIISSPTVIAANGDATMTRFDNVREDDVRTGEVGVRRELKTGAVSHKLSASASTFHAESRNAYAMSDFAGFRSNLYRPADAAPPSTSFWTGGKMNDPLPTQKTILSSVAIADTLGFLDERVLVTLGARYQKIKDFGYDYNTGAQSAPGYEKSEVTPVAAIVYKPAKGVSIYANYAEALQKGPVASGPNIVNQGEVFAPFVARQKEAGVKYDSGKLGMSAAVFTISRPSGAVVNNRFGIYGAQRNRGLELNVFGMPTQGLRLLGGLTLLDAEQTTTGKDVIGVPDTQLNLGADWEVPGVQGLSVNARLLHTAKQYANESNSQQLPSWNRLDIGANYAMRLMDRDVTLRARIDNVTDKRYWASAGGYPGYGYLVQGGPRSVVVSATVDF